MKVRRCWLDRRGNITVFSAVLMIVMMGMIAFAVDVGTLFVGRNELQRSADAAALAAAWELIDSESVSGGTYPQILKGNARQEAEEFAGYNAVRLASPTLAEADVRFGYWAAYSPPTSAWSESSGFQEEGVASLGIPLNAVEVTVRREATQNGELPLFFARLLGRGSASTRARAVAAMMAQVSGFEAPEDDSNLELLPLALDQDTFNSMLGGAGTDDWKWNKYTGQVEPGSDGILEMNLYPQGTGSPGNRGTVDIGSNNNSTADIARQVLYGVSPQDLAYHGGKLELGADGKLYLNGDTGISAGIKDELATIKGGPRIIPIFSDVVGPGNNATYTIVQFVGIRIMDVKLTGSVSSKRVIVQPAVVVTRGGLAPTDANNSHYVYSPVWLVD